ncbi:hypothetical protein GCM10010302_73350 [Streptomyces polychromogenes]|uniref:Uncharacterized protein n=1 Tax=Streptomyces polychromogenes TaxID=67342 RepID=A0ABN0W2N1_9ACTN
MTTQPTPERPAGEAKRGRAGVGPFLIGTAASFAFFAFFPGLPHVIDWGAILISLAIGGLARWIWLARAARKHADPG